jgi:hypothetical protein
MAYIQRNETIYQQGAAYRIHFFHRLVIATFQAQQQDDDESTNHVTPFCSSKELINSSNSDNINWYHYPS